MGIFVWYNGSGNKCSHSKEGMTWISNWSTYIHIHFGQKRIVRICWWVCVGQMVFVVLVVIITKLSIFEHVDYTASSLSAILQINYRSAQLLLKKIHYAHEFNGIRLNLFQMVRDSVTDFINHSNHELVEGTPQTVLNQNSPKDWDLHSYIESKINRLNSKLTIRGMLLNNNQRYVYNRVQSGKGSLGLFNKWIKTLVSIHLYPTFLKCFQVPA